VRPEILHRLALVEGAAAACARLDLRPDRPEGPCAQLRYFAVEGPFRGRGVGQILLRRLEEEAVERGAARLWMYARTAAINFYARAGYLDTGAGPTLYGCIAHRVMEKNLLGDPRASA
jgi:GNAT superfamily N-acetyltransferase